MREGERGVLKLRFISVLMTFNIVRIMKTFITASASGPSDTETSVRPTLGGRRDRL